jgi:hypothetical protein
VRIFPCTSRKYLWGGFSLCLDWLERADRLKGAGDADGTALFKKWAGTGRKCCMGRGVRMYMQDSG